MSQEDATSNGDANGSGGGRQRRPALDRTEPHRGWSNLYAPGKADRLAGEPRRAHASEPVPPPADGGPSDAQSRVVREGYRIVEENLRRGRQVAAELRGVQREVAGFAGRIGAQRAVSDFAQTLIDPALTEQLVGLARSFLGVLGAAVPTATEPPAASAPPAREAQVPLHPQERPGYSSSGPRVLKMRATGPGEWLADLEIEGKVRRVQVRAVDEEL